jgi:hypothetical protein
MFAMTRQPFRTKCSPAGKDALLVTAFKTDASLEQCVSCLRLVLGLLDDEGTTQNVASLSVDVANALHFAGQDSQYTVSVRGPAAYVQGVYRRFLRAPESANEGAIRFVCSTTPIGSVRGRRLEFPDGNISMPVVTLASVPELAGLLRLRLGAEWPPSHTSKTCTASSGTHAALV